MLLKSIMAAAILAISSVAFSKMMSNLFDAMSKAEGRITRAAIASTINGLVDCSITFVPGVTCTDSGQKVSLYTKTGRILVDKKDSQFGMFTVRAICDKSKSSILVQTKLTHTETSLSAPESQLFGGYGLCSRPSSDLAGSSSSAAGMAASPGLWDSGHALCKKYKGHGIAYLCTPNCHKMGNLCKSGMTYTYQNANSPVQTFSACYCL